MNDLDTREWLLTEGLGSFASGTVSDAYTRTHGLLTAALDPPSHRTLLLSRVIATLEIGGQHFALDTNFWGSGAIEPQGYKLLKSFQTEPVPIWVWGQAWQLSRALLMPHVQPDRQSGDGQDSRILIHYRYEGRETAKLALRFLVGDRDFHHQQHADPSLCFAS